VGRNFRHVGFLIAAIYLFAGVLAKAETKMLVEPALGLGISSLNMSVKTQGEDLEYTSTNSSFYFVNIAVDQFSFQAKFPIKDQIENRVEKGDTKVTDFQAGFGFKTNWLAELYYQRYEGYYVQSKTARMIHDDLTMQHVGTQLTYVFDPSYSAAMTRTTSWKQSSSKGSWMLSAGYDEFDLDGDLVPRSLNTSLRSALDRAKVRSISARVSRGHNWIWKNWFAGILIGAGANLSDIQYQYSGSTDSNTDMKMIYNTGFSAGYQWGQSKVGFFARSYSWDIAFDDKELTSSTSLTGVYYSSYF
jgi:hypothetical protein